MNILLFSTLYPNAEHPHHGIFVENRLRHLLADSGYSAHVVAPVPWFPFQADRFGRYARLARVPKREARHGLTIDHPRYPVIPRLGMTVAPWLLYRSARRALLRLRKEGHRFDLIDAHYFYPDGVAAALLARDFGLPLTITGRGTDLNLIPRYPLCRRQIAWAANRADGLITVCNALADDLAALGPPRDKVTVLRNGVDLSVFRPDSIGARQLRRERGAVRDGEPLILSVGHLIDRKGHNLAIDAMARLGRGQLWIVGSGPEEKRLKALAAAQGVAERVQFLGTFPHDQLARVYSAGDVLVLASSREGWPNVLLESMACGTPVVATPVNGSPEVVRDAIAGTVVGDRTPEALAEGLASVLDRAPDRAAVRRYAEAFSWTETSRGQMALFKAICSRGAAAPGATAAMSDDPIDEAEVAALGDDRL